MFPNIFGFPQNVHRFFPTCSNVSQHSQRSQHVWIRPNISRSCQTCLDCSQHVPIAPHIFKLPQPFSDAPQHVQIFPNMFRLFPICSDVPKHFQKHAAHTCITHARTYTQAGMVGNDSKAMNWNRHEKEVRPQTTKRAGSETPNNETSRAATTTATTTETTTRTTTATTATTVKRQPR